MEKKDCKGCVLELDNCAFFDDHIQCPCQQCLVKVMCGFPCELLKDHSVKPKVHKPKRLDRR